MYTFNSIFTCMTLFIWCHTYVVINFRDTAYIKTTFFIWAVVFMLVIFKYLYKKQYLKYLIVPMIVSIFAMITTVKINFIFDAYFHDKDIVFKQKNIVARDVVLQGCAVDEKRYEKYSRLLLDNIQILGASDNQSKFHGRVYLYISRKKSKNINGYENKCGEWKVRLKPIYATLNNIGFDYERWLFAQKIHAKASVIEEIELFENKYHGINKIYAYFRYKRKFLSEKISNYFIHDSNELIQKGVSNQFLHALLLGDRSLLQDEVNEKFRYLGLSHLIAISGLHVGIVYLGLLNLFRLMALVYAFVLKICLRKLRIDSLLGQCIYKISVPPSQIYIQFFLLWVVLGYCLITGWHLPVQRAWYMLCLYWLITCIGYRPSLIICIASVMMLFMVINPIYTLSISLQLSLFALLIIFLYQSFSMTKLNTACSNWSLDKIAYIKESCSRWFKNYFVLQLWFFFLTWGVIAYVFSQISLLSLVANSISVIAVTFLFLPLGLLSLIFFAFNLDVWAEYSLKVNTYFVEAWYWAMNYLAEISHKIAFSVSIFHLPLAYLFFSACIFLLLFYLGEIRKLVIGIQLFILINLLMPKNNLEEGDYLVNIMDVGQGLAILVETKKHQLLFDLGASFGSFNFFNVSILPYLKRHQIYLDTLVVSHHDNDHAGGFSHWIDRRGKNNLRHSVDVFVPDQDLKDYGEKMLGLANVNLKSCQNEYEWTWDNVRFKFLWSGQRYSSSNNNSCVLMIDSKRGRLLIPADIEKKVEASLVKKYGSDLKADVLIAPHHGSKTSSSYPFIKSVSPRNVIYSSGRGNRYGHPHEKIVKLYSDLQIIQHNTACTGQLSIHYSDRIQMSFARKDKYRLWHSDCP